jgi:MazG family protein
MATQLQENKYNFEDLIEIMQELRDPKNGCEWNKSQNSSSIRKYCIEEAYEVIESIESQDIKSLCEELGDLLFQVIFHSQINKEESNFDINDVIQILCEKMIRRHPHVFNNDKKEDKSKIESTWEKIKEEERISKGKEGILSDIPNAFPAIIRSIKIQKRASRNGFDWDNIEDVLNKVSEEFEELNQALEINDLENANEEIGDLMFSIINLSRKLRIDPESSLRNTNNKFTKRIYYIEKKLEKEDKKFNQTSLSELEEIWNEAKNKTKQVIS